MTDTLLKNRHRFCLRTLFVTSLRGELNLLG